MANDVEPVKVIDPNLVAMDLLFKEKAASDLALLTRQTIHAVQKTETDTVIQMATANNDTATKSQNKMNETSKALNY